MAPTTAAPTTEPSGLTGIITATLTELKDMGGNTESVEYDADNNVYYFVNWATERIGTISGDYQSDSDTSELDADVYPNTTGTNHNSSAGMVYYDGMLYIADIGSGLSVFDVSDGSLQWELAAPFGFNGLCQDPDNLNMLYGTSVGIDFATYIAYSERAGLWSVDTDTQTLTRLYWGNDTQWNESYVLQPNGCIVRDGIIYMVETRPQDDTGSLGQYVIDSGVMTYSTDLLSVAGSGIAIDWPYMFVSSWSDGGMLMGRNMMDSSSVFETLVTNITTPAKLCV